MVVGTAGAGAGTVKVLGDRILGLNIGFTGVRGVVRILGEQLGETLPLNDVIHKS